MFNTATGFLCLSSFALASSHGIKQTALSQLAAQLIKTSSLQGHKNFQLLEVYTREDPSFIQGLYFDTDKQQLLESTGLNGESKT